MKERFVVVLRSGKFCEVPLLLVAAAAELAFFVLWINRVTDYVHPRIVHMYPYIVCIMDVHNSTKTSPPAPTVCARPRTLPSLLLRWDRLGRSPTAGVLDVIRDTGEKRLLRCMLPVRPGIKNHRCKPFRFLSCLCLKQLGPKHRQVFSEDSLAVPELFRM